MILTTPENQYIQFSVTEPSQDIIVGISNSHPTFCNQFFTPNLCLPVRQVYDLAFEMSIPVVVDTPPDDYVFFISVCKDCVPINMTGYRKGFIRWKISNDGTRYVGYVYGWANGINLANYLDAGECFGLCLNYPSYQYLFDTGGGLDYPLTNISISLTFGATTQTLNFIGVVNSVTDILGLLNANPFFHSLGHWQTDLDENIILKTNTSIPIITPNMHIESVEQTYDLPLILDYWTSDALGAITNTACNPLQCFIYTPESCYSTVIKYRCNENAFGFDYNNSDNPDTGGSNELLPFYNQVRLPFFLKNPQILTKKKVYRKSDGNYIKMSARMEKELSGEVEWITEDWHTKLAIALEHDEVWMWNEDTIMWEKVIFDESENYEIDWSNNTRGTNLGIAPASFKVKKMPFNQFNSNCIEDVTP